MFNPRAIAYVFGTLLLVTAGAMVAPAICALFYPQDGDFQALIQSVGVIGALGRAAKGPRAECVAVSGPAPVGLRLNLRCGEKRRRHRRRRPKSRRAWRFHRKPSLRLRLL